MRTVSDAEAQEWCVKRGFVVEHDFPLRAAPQFDGARRFRLQIPDEATATVGLAYVLLMSGVREGVEANFDGAVVWFRRWELWSESIDRVGQFMLEAVRDTLKNDGPLDEKPALVYSERELIPAHASLSLPMLFQWDAFYCPHGGQLFAAISHHGALEVLAPSEAYSDLVERFSQWNPEEV